MTDELLSLRAVLLSATQNDHDMFRQAASTARVPIEIVECKSVAAACQAVGGGADLVFIDGAIANVATVQVVAVARAQAKPPFLVLLAAPDAVIEPLATDAAAAKPMRLEEARRLVERSMRVRLPSRVLVVDDSSTMRSIVRKNPGDAFSLRRQRSRRGWRRAQARRRGIRHRLSRLLHAGPRRPGDAGRVQAREAAHDCRGDVVGAGRFARRARGAQGAAFLKKPFFSADLEAVLTRHYGLTALNPQRA